MKLSPYAAAAAVPVAVQHIIESEAACAAVYVCSLVNFDRVLVPLSLLNLPSTPVDMKTKSWKLVYDVMRVHDSAIMFSSAHFERIEGSYNSVATANGLHCLSSAAMSCVKAAVQEYIHDPSVYLDIPVTTPRERESCTDEDNNVKFIAWLPDSGQCHVPSTSTSTIIGQTPTTPERGLSFVVFLVKSFFPPSSWYRTGTDVALLLNAERENPSAKVVQAELRTRAKEMQTALGVFEVLLVHGKDSGFIIPEGSRSNYLLLMPDGRVLCSEEEDILMGVTLKAVTRARGRCGASEVIHQKLTLKELCEAQSMVMLGTSPGVLPVRSVLLYGEGEVEKGGRSCCTTRDQFDVVAAASGVDVSKLKNVVHMPEKKGAALRFEVQSEAVTMLMEQYAREAML